MEEQLSPAAARAVDWAKGSAVARGATEVGWADLLAGLLAEEESQATSALRQHGAQLAAVFGSLGIAAPIPEVNTEQVRLDRYASRAISRAHQLAIAFSRYEPTGSEELLVALLETSAACAEVLQQHGFDKTHYVESYHRRREPELVPVDGAALDFQVREPTDRVDACRIVDANANRLREALRVLEDFARFALDDDRISGRLKQCRHWLREALDRLPAHWLISARDTRGDVGTTISSPDEHRRASLADVVRANCKRSQESARTLEECAKLESVTAARMLERLRYELYSIERLLHFAGQARGMLANTVLYWLVDPDACARSVEWMIEQASRGGVQAIQLRDKTSGGSRAVGDGSPECASGPAGWG